MGNDRPVVFLGPSLPLCDAQMLLPSALFLPPIKRGALLSFVDDPPPVIGIIDGVFYQNLAISPKEILTFLKLGARIFGAASMGALRAVELYPYGMVGIGQIFRLYRCGRVTGDDEVAVRLCPDTLRPLSEPLVNIRIALKAAIRDGIVPAREASCIIREMKTMYFPERTLPTLFAVAQRILSPDQLSLLREWWLRCAPNAKRDDAKELLQRIAA